MTNRDPEAKIQEFLAWLLQDPTDQASPASAAQFSNSGFDLPFSSAESVSEEDRLIDEFDALDAEDFNQFSPSSGNLATNSQPREAEYQEGQPLEIGEIPIVQKRFQALLKQRLKAEIESNLPRFPWENEVSEYYDDADIVPKFPIPAQLWITQLSNLDLPIPIPESVLTQLLHHCQEVAQSGLREGAKLVQAVEGLFPNQFQTLNQLAGLVIVSPARSGATMESPAVKFPDSYEVATPVQQMLLSLLAARQLIQDLTLSLALGQSIQRQWQTAAGLLRLEVEYQRVEEVLRLRVQGELPSGGTLRLAGRETQATVQRPTAGVLALEVFDVQPNQCYPLEIELDAQDKTPLIFTICPTF